MKIPYSHPRYNDIKDEANTRFDRDFNQVDLSVAEKSNKEGELRDFITRPSFRVLALEWLGKLRDSDEREVYTDYLEERSPEPDEDDLVKEAIAAGDVVIDEDSDQEGMWYFKINGEGSDISYSSEEEAEEAVGEILGKQWYALRAALIDRLICENPEILDEISMPDDVDQDDFYEWLEAEKEDEVIQEFDESEHYPMWSTLFEAKDNFLSRKVAESVDELYELGIGVIEHPDFNSMLFIGGAGYDFYEAHWIPMYIMFGWIEPKKFPGPDVKLTGCNNCGNTKFRYPQWREVEVKSREWAPLEDRGGAYLTQPVKSEHEPNPPLICTYCGAEHARSNFEWLPD